MCFTYLMELNFFEATVSLLLIVHVKDLDQLHGNDFLGLYIFGFEDIRELSLTYMFINEWECFEPTRICKNLKVFKVLNRVIAKDNQNSNSTY